MPIVHMHDNNSSEFPDGAYCPIGGYSYNFNQDIQQNNVIVLSESHHGLCLYETENNYYDDSDFFMVVWNPELKKTEKINFATTRAWTYPCYASKPDATKRVKTEYEAWLKYEERKQAILAKRKARQKMQAECRVMGITHLEYAKAIGSGLFDVIYSLLKVKKFRSTFRSSCAHQVREWLANADAKFNTPLSKRQLAALRIS